MARRMLLITYIVQRPAIISLAIEPAGHQPLVASVSFRDFCGTIALAA
jgi:hypothetical protein